MEFLKEVKESANERTSALDIQILDVLIPVCKRKATYSKYIALCWIYEYLKLKLKEWKEKGIKQLEKEKDEALIVNKLSEIIEPVLKCLSDDEEGTIPCRPSIHF